MKSLPPTIGPLTHDFGKGERYNELMQLRYIGANMKRGKGMSKKQFLNETRAKLNKIAQGDQESIDAIDVTMEDFGLIADKIWS